MLVDKDILIKVIFKDLFNKNIENVDLIKQILIVNTNTSVIEFMMHIMANPDFELLYPGDYFKTFLPDKYIGQNCEIDHLIDLGLYKDGYVYGKIVKSDDYGDKHEPCFPSMKVELLFHNSEIIMEPQKATMSTHQLIKIDKSEIKYFNHGAD